MYRFLSALAKPTISAHKEGMRLQMIKDELCRMFSTDDNKQVLTSLFQILPTYFNQKHVEEFAHSPHIHQYVEYVNKKIPDKKKFKEVESQYLQKNKQKSIINCQNTIYLEAYLHWLTKEYSFFSPQNNQYLLEYTHLQNPQKLFEPFKNNQKRVFIYHHGPTNSGKSTSAIEQLKNLPHTEKGIYMAPLRLLAWQYHKKLGNCTLITGQEKTYKNSNLISCTIEAANLSDEYSVAVIDQIQMIADDQRGWAWTKAILALKAKRIHLCGDERALGIISKLVRENGDILQERKYSRLSKLILIHKNFKLEKLEAGDCIIDFSSNKIIKHRNDVNKMMSSKQKVKQKAREEEKKKKQKKRLRKEKQEQIQQQTEIKNNYAAIIYGKLPPECRKDQANLFNEGKLPYLVATNAIGMGLNLNIKKIIFTTIQKPTNYGVLEQLQDHEIQQIAGRAGRGKQTGYVQCTNNEILQKVKRALSTVNKLYGIQLQSQQDETGQAMQMKDLQPVQKKVLPKREIYNELLGRQMTQKQCQIKKACFYFTPNFLTDFKLRMNWLMEIDFSILDQIDYLKKYSKLNNIYFYQSTKHMGYLVKLLQKNQFDLKDLLVFYSGLSLSIPPNVRKQLSLKIKKSHRQFIQNFIKYRRVPLPGFLVYIYKYCSHQFEFMEQLSELQLYYNLLETYVWLWNKYQFAFYEIALAKEIKMFLQNKISTILKQNRFKSGKIETNQVQIDESASKVQIEEAKKQENPKNDSKKKQSKIVKKTIETKSKTTIRPFFTSLNKSKLRKQGILMRVDEQFQKTTFISEIILEDKQNNQQNDRLWKSKQK